jgi:HSP20 family protein
MYEINTQFPLTDILKTDDYLVVIMDIPGIKPNDVILRLAPRMLKIDLPSSDQVKVEGHYYKLERQQHQNITREIDLPEQIDPESIQYTLSRGVLTIKLKITKEVFSVRTIQLL